MIATSKPEMVNFGAEGQVVIPTRLRKEFDIEEGSKAEIYEENGCIILKPIPTNFIKSLRGSLKGSGVLKAMIAERQRERQM